MPRQSAESRAAASYLAGSAPPPPPKHLSKAAGAIWIEIAASKPADWFDAGSQPLLEQYCVLIVHMRALNRRIDRLMKAGSWEELKPYEKRRNQMSATLATLATKLRLSVQAVVEWHSRKLDERGAQPEAKAKKADPLLGGRAVWASDKPGAKPN
jgi:hypothetical protein